MNIIKNLKKEVESMNNDFLFEQKKIKPKGLIMLLITIFFQISFLYFFTLIGRFEHDDILKNYSTILGLSSTITICTLIIIGAIFVNKLIVADFIGDSRTRTYLYLDGRNKLYIRKTYAFAIIILGYLLFGSIIANVIYFFIESIFPILDINTHISNVFPTIIISTISIPILTTMIIIFSSIIGIWFSSPIATIISSVIFVTFIGNLIAFSFIYNQYILLVIILFISLLAYIAIKITANRIKNDNVTYK